MGGPTSPKARQVLGTNMYIAPEAYLGEYSPASDMFCVGVMMYTLLTRRYPFRMDMFDDRPGENYVGSPAMQRIRDRMLNYTIDFSRDPFHECEAAASLCKSLMSFDPSARPSADEALQHEWFRMPARLIPQ